MANPALRLVRPIREICRHKGDYILGGWAGNDSEGLNDRRTRVDKTNRPGCTNHPKWAFETARFPSLKLAEVPSRSKKLVSV